MKFLLTALLLMSNLTWANTISFRCVSSNLPGIHKFDAHGIVSLDDNNSVEGTVTINTQKADAIQSAQSFEDIRVEGYVRRFSAGEVTKDPFDQLVLKTSEPYLKTLNLLLDFEDNIASKVISIDNFSFRSSCKTTTTFKE